MIFSISLSKLCRSSDDPEAKVFALRDNFSPEKRIEVRAAAVVRLRVQVQADDRQCRRLERK